MHRDDAWSRCTRLLADASGFADDQELVDVAQDGLLFEDAARQPRTAVELLAMRRRSLPSGLGSRVDNQLLAGGLHDGEILEIFGAAGVGKTQMALTIAEHAASSGVDVCYLTSKDPPLSLACRLGDIFLARHGRREAELEAALERVRFAETADFAELARCLTSLSSPSGEVAAEKPGILIVDMISLLLAPFVAARSAGHRWRLAWAWRALRRLAQAGYYVVVLSHTVGGSHFASGSNIGAGVGPQQALGAAWAAAASVRLELSHSDALAQFEARAAEGLVLTLCRSSRRAEGCRVAVFVGQDGVNEESGCADGALNGAIGWAQAVRAPIAV